MSWPVYTPPQGSAHLLPLAVREHNESQLSPLRMGPPAKYGCAVDIWSLTPATPLGPCRHLWRSYDPATGEDIEAWARREQAGYIYKMDFKGTKWAMPPMSEDIPIGVQVPHVGEIQDWPVPTKASLTGPMSLREIHAMVHAMLSICQLPEQPYGFERIPTVPAITQRLVRGGGSTVLCTIAEGFAIRTWIAPYATAPSKPVEVGSKRYSVTLSTRFISTRKTPDFLRDQVQGVWEFDVPEGASQNVITSKAKRLAGYPNFPATEKFRGFRYDIPEGTRLYHFLDIPYQITISSLDTQPESVQTEGTT